MSERDAQRMRDQIERERDEWNRQGAAWRLLEACEGEDWAAMPIDQRERVLNARRDLELPDPPTLPDRRFPTGTARST